MLRIHLPKSLMPLLLVAGAIVGCASVSTPEGWQQGKFTGGITGNDSRTEFELTCSASETCDLQVIASAGNRKPTTQAIPTKKPVAMAAEIANNNLDHARSSVTRNPSLYQSPQHGPDLRAIKSILDSKSKLSACLDIGADAPQYVAVCTLDSDIRATKTVVLIVSTMSGRCGDAPFCAYNFYPLIRVAR